MEQQVLASQDLQRLTTFKQTPINKNAPLPLSNSSLKLSAAGFEREPNATEDEVTCSACRVSYRDWCGESPIRVHRVISPSCPFLNSPPPTNNDSSLQKLQDVRRELFPTDNGERRSLVRYATLHPFRPKFGGYEMHFESKRLQTFSHLLSNKNELWARNGFVYRSSTHDLQCVYCGLEVVANGLQPHLVHQRRSPDCPLVMMIDVGNISRSEEEKIRRKYNLQQLKRAQTSYVKLNIKHPQFESELNRKGTFQSWPKMLATLYPADLMSSAGFFYTGITDKVSCYSCGISLSSWIPDTDVWKLHAKVSPACQHILQNKGENFVSEAVHIQVQIEVLQPEEQVGQVTSRDGLVAREPGNLILDIKTIKAAIECKYSAEQIHRAVLRFFSQTSRFPNKELLLGTLKATDDYLSLVRQKNLEKENALLEKDFERNMAIQEKEQEMERIMQEMQKAMQEKEEKERALQEKEQEMQRAMQEKEQILRDMQKKEEEMQRALQEKKEKERALQEKEQEMQWALQEKKEKEQEMQRAVQEKKEKERALQEKEQEMQRALQEKETVVNEIIQKDNALQEKDHALQEMDHALQEKDHALQEKDQLIENLMKQLQKLQAHPN